MKINQISQILGTELQKAAGGPKAAGKPDKAGKADSVSLSSQARELSRAAEADAPIRRIQGMPDIREDKLQAVRDKLSSGYYDSAEFTDQLADRLIQDFGLGQA